MADNSISSGIISLPKGGGALTGIGEKFSPDLHTGTGNFTVPIALPPGRNGFQPQLNLVYSTGQGNGPFGLGWQHSIPGVSRKTSKGIPHYDDLEDIFILSGSEDLVAVRKVGPITYYRPRTEGLFAEILHHRDGGNSYWEVRSKDGLVSTYGTQASFGTDPATIADPSERTHIFAWKLTRTRDPFGNIIQYEYARDTGEEGAHHWDQLYLSNIKYVDYGARTDPQFLVTVEFLYGQRPNDPYSEYRAGFEIRTRKRCTSIVVRTHAEEDLRASAYDFLYLDQRPDLKSLWPLNGVSLLSQVNVTGYDRDKSEALPPLEFRYTVFDLEKRDFFPLQGSDLPARSLANPDLELVDLFGNGLPDFVEMNGTVRYWKNLGNGRFDWPRFMSDAPAGIALADAGVQFIDANGDGRTDLLVTTAAMSGYFPLNFAGQWDRKSFQRYRQAPSFNLEDPEVKLVDLDGDGVTDAIRSGSRLECFFNDPNDGWNNTRWVERRALEVFPNINFSDPRVKWADITGDGLQDVALVYDGNVEYWPNLGHGNWGKRIHMENSPRFPDGYNPRRILVGDVDGDGLADIVYVDDTKVTLWINESGNRWSGPIEITGTPPVSDIDAVRLVDLLGNGISGVLWTRDASGLSRDHYFFLDFTGGLKPYLLHQMDNNLGAVTKVGYAPSVRFYLDDQTRPETRWKTTLPFPVQVVSRVEVIDCLSKGKLTREYHYHDGHWDGGDREFRGFGMVDQRDSESFEDYDANGLHGEEVDFAKVPRQYFSPTTLTKTWFHLGPVGDEYGDWHELDQSEQYWVKDAQFLKHSETVREFLKGLSERRVKRDALRALRGSILRSELYAVDGSERETRPYTVTESSYGLVEFDPPSTGDTKRLHIFFPHALSQRSSQWERGEDPMTRFSFTRYTDENDRDKFDPIGRPLAQTQIACPRGWRGTGDTPSQPYLATRSGTIYAKSTDPKVYIHNRVARVTSFEIVNTPGKRLTDIATIRDASADLKVIAQTFNFYDGGAFVGLPLGQIDKFGAVTRTENLVLTEEILKDAYGTEVPPYIEPAGGPLSPGGYPSEFLALLPLRAGYTFHGGSADPSDVRGYFVNTERRRYDFQSGPNEYGLVLETRDPLHDASVNPSGHRTLVAYDDKYQLLPNRVINAAGLTIQAIYDYRVLQPSHVTDPNGNTSRFVFSPLGLLQDCFIRGKSSTEGDVKRPSVRMEYDLLAFRNSPRDHRQPIYVRTIRHVHHDTDVDVVSGALDETIEVVEYSDGFGRLLQRRTQGEDLRFGDERFGGGEEVLSVKQSDGAGGDVIGRKNNDTLNPNVVVSGWQICDNKGQVVEKYEPFFSEGWGYGKPGDKQTGQKLAMYYDARGHTIRTVNPDGSQQLVVYGVPGTIASPDLTNPDLFEPTPWEAYTYDANDNAGRTHPAEASSFRYHWNTPASILVDSLGRTVKAVARNRNPVAHPGDPPTPMQELGIQTTYDIRGNVLTITDELGRNAFHHHIYDYANHLLRKDSIDAGLRQTVLNAIGGVIEQRDSKGSLILYGHDGLNRPLRLWGRDGTDQELTLRERLEYGDGGTPAQSPTDRGSNQAANRLGRPSKHYEEAGLLTFEAYDFKGNLLQKTRAVVSDATILNEFSPPPPSWNIKAFRVNWANTTAVPLDAQTYTSTITYDALNRPIVMTYPGDVENRRRNLRPHYNLAGALERVTMEHQTPGGAINSETFVDRIAYNAKGQRVLIAYGNEIMTRFAYDPYTFRLQHLRSERFNEPVPLTYRSTGDLLQSFAYDYDLRGNILVIHDRTPGSGIKGTTLGLQALDREFTYDAVYRLWSATGRECDLPPDFPWDDLPRGTDLNKTRGYRETYAYDAVGNITELKHLTNGAGFTRTFKLAPANNRLSSLTLGAPDPTAKVFTYEFDKNGNMTKEATSRHFEWDHADRMRAYRTQTNGSEPSVYAHYLYDASGQRVKKLVRKQGGKLEVTVYIDGVFEHQWIVQGSSITENNTVHVMDNQSRIAMVRAGAAFPDDTTPAEKYHLGDHLGSSNVVVDGMGSLVNREEYTPYGETSCGNFAHKRYRYTGKERDEESGLSYHGARYYSSWLGRWTTPDPAGPVNSLNLFTYVRGQPLHLVDPNGLTESDPFPPDPSREAAQGLRDLANGPSQVAKKLLETWNAFRQKAADTVFSPEARKAYDTAKAKPELQPIKPYGGGLPVIDQIIKETPAVSGGLWLAFAGSFRAGPKIPVVARPFSTVARATSIYNKIVSALESAEGGGVNPGLQAFKEEGMVAVARVNIAGKARVYVGVKVPKGTFGNNEGTEIFPTKEVGEWVKNNVLKEGEELAGVTASRTHAEGPLQEAIVRDAKAAGIDPATVQGTIGAKIDVCHGCQTNVARELPNVKPENPAP